ncbi:MAG: hypothetical protein LBK00_11475 [Treponema sp.]|jgi:hypothetical protein|nr:hypothetical protein [Treponema sp.]
MRGFFYFILISLFSSLYGLDLPTRYIADDSSLRRALLDTWFTEAPERVLSRPYSYYRLPSGDRIQVRAEAGRDEFMTILARELNGDYPGWAQGSWILTRRRDTGEVSRIRVFLRSDPQAYVQFRPLDKDRSAMDVVLYDAYVVRSLPLPYSIERLMVLPVEEAFSVAGNKFPRRYFDPNPAAYRDMRTMINKVQQALPLLNYRDDGAIDENGRYVFIETLEPQSGELGLNCSGFAKWVIDGILRPYTGTTLSIPPLKTAFGERGSSFTKAYEAIYDLFFGLDWGRHLASIAGTVLRTPDSGNIEEIEVHTAPFASRIERTRGEITIRSYPEYQLDIGFQSEGIHALLYTLAIDEPGNLYIATISREMANTQRLRQYFHLAILLPHFTETGEFQVTVFESAAETSFADFKTRYPGLFINLLRVPVEARFEPFQDNLP